ncbi:MAG: SsrA-binding protein SmpB [Polyangia bacterium]
MANKPDPEVKSLLRNKKARHDYTVEEELEAGVSLMGSEVKSLREGRAVMTDAYIFVKDGQAYLSQLQISEYPWANIWNHAPKRDRKLLLHKKEIGKLDEKTSREGYTLIPLDIYLRNGRIKVLVGVCKGKKTYDKRQTEREKTAKREVDAAMKKARR